MIRQLKPVGDLPRFELTVIGVLADGNYAAPRLSLGKHSVFVLETLAFNLVKGICLQASLIFDVLKGKVSLSCPVADVLSPARGCGPRSVRR